MAATSQQESCVGVASGWTNGSARQMEVVGQNRSGWTESKRLDRIEVAGRMEVARENGSGWIE